VPGTTRDHIEVPLSLGGVPLRLTDTAGLRETSDAVEAVGVARAARLVESADVVVWLGDPGDAPDHPQLIRLHAKADLCDRGGVPEGSIAVSSLSGEGIAQLLGEIERQARAVLPAEDVIALNRRQARHIGEAADAVSGAAAADDVVLIAENLRLARAAFDRLTGRAGIEDVLNALFGRFCLGK